MKYVTNKVSGLRYRYVSSLIEIFMYYIILFSWNLVRQDFKKLNFSQFVIMISNNQKLFYKTKRWKFQTEWLICDDLPVYWHYFEEIVTNSLKNTIIALRLSQFLHFKLIFVSNSNNDLGLLLFNIQLPLFIILLYFEKASKIKLKNCY